MQTYTRRTDGTASTHTVFRTEDQRVIGYVWFVSPVWQARPWKGQRVPGEFSTKQEAIDFLAR